MIDASNQSAAEMRSLLGFARGLGLDEATVREIYETVGREAAADREGEAAHAQRGIQCGTLTLATVSRSQ